MSDSARLTLQEALGGFVVPHTGRPLGGPGAAFTLERRGSVWHVTVRLGFPLAVVAFVLVKKLYVRETLGEATPVPGETAPGTASRTSE